MSQDTALADTLSGPFMRGIASMFDALETLARLTASPSAWGTVLGVCLAIRATKALLEIAADDDGLASLGAALVRGVILTVVLGAILQNWLAIQAWGWGIAGEATVFAGSTGGFAGITGSSGTEIVTNALGALFSASVTVYAELWSALLQGGTGVLAAIMALMDNPLTALMAFGTAVCALVFIGVLTYHVLVSAFGVAAGLLFGPLALAFFPILQSWTFNLVGLLAASIARLMMTMFVAGAATIAARTMVATLQRGVDGDIARMQAMLAIGVVLVLLAAGASALIGYAGQIFGNANSSLGFGRGTRGVVGAGAGAFRSAGRAAAGAGAAVGGAAIRGGFGGHLQQAAGGSTAAAGALAQVGGALSAMKGSSVGRLASYMSSSKSRK